MSSTQQNNNVTTMFVDYCLCDGLACLSSWYAHAHTHTLGSAIWYSCGMLRKFQVTQAFAISYVVERHRSRCCCVPSFLQVYLRFWIKPREKKTQLFGVVWQFLCTARSVRPAASASGKPAQLIRPYCVNVKCDRCRRSVLCSFALCLFATANGFCPFFACVCARARYLACFAHFQLENLRCRWHSLCARADVQRMHARMRVCVIRMYIT